MFFKKRGLVNNSSKVPALIFDFGTSSVKILRCDYLLDKVEILDGKKVVYPAGCISGDEFTHPERLFAPLSEAVAGLSGGAKQTVLSAAVGIGGLSVAGFTSQINYRRARNENPIANAEFQSILKKVEDRADQIMRKLIAWETAEGNTSKLINSEVLDLTLDGYSVASPVGSAGQKLSFTVYNSYTKEANLKAVTGLITDLKLDLVSVSPTMYAQLRLLLESMDMNFSGILLDVGGKTTELGLVTNGRIIGHLAFDVAGESFSRSIAEELGRDFEQGESFKLGFAAGSLPEDLSKDVREILANDCKVFLSGVELLLREFPGVRDFPERVYVSGGGGLLPGLVSSIQAANLDKEKTDSETSVYALGIMPKDISGYRDLTGKLNSAADVPALTIALDAADLIRAD